MSMEEQAAKIKKMTEGLTSEQEKLAESFITGLLLGKQLGEAHKEEGQDEKAVSA